MSSSEATHRMRDQLQRIEANIQKSVRHVCNDLVQNVNKELQTLQEHASKLEEYEIQQRVERPGCILQEHTSKLEDYEDLQKQHRLTLETCDSLRKQNVRLQNQVKDLLAERSLLKSSENVQTTPQPEESPAWKFGPGDVSPNVKRLVEDHPDLQAAMTSQFKDYKKLQKAHIILLGKLKDRQRVIEQLRGHHRGSETEDNDDNARLARLRSIIAGRSSKSPIGTTPESTSSPTETNGSSITTRTTRIPGSDQAGENENPIVIRSSLPNGSDGTADAERIVTASTAENIVQPLSNHGVLSPHPVTESEPEFISERPVKKRRTGARRSGGLSDGPVKMEPVSPDNGAQSDHQGSIDLDAVYTPIGPPENRFESTNGNLSNVIDAANITYVERHSEPPPDSVHISAEEYPSAYKSVSFTANALGRSGNDGDALIDSFDPAGRQRDIADLKGTRRRSAVQSNSSNNQTRHRFEASAIHDGANSKESRVKRTANPLKRKLREKIAGDLSINDFKLNPAMNRGFNQTMGEGSLKKSRYCAADCSKPECCASAFATAIRKAGIASIDELSGSGKDQVISKYLGFPVFRLGDISSDAYQTLLGEAIGKQFAEKYGKQQHIRANSPPGYWRVDFPTTQDRIADENKSNELERETVKHRRREALRDGGLWVFRDE